MFNRQIEKQIRAGRRLKDEVVALAIQDGGKDAETGKSAIVKLQNLTPDEDETSLEDFSKLQETDKREIKKQWELE